MAKEIKNEVDSKVEHSIKEKSNTEKQNKKVETKKQNKKQGENRFADVIEKMEEETVKVEKIKKGKELERKNVLTIIENGIKKANLPIKKQEELELIEEEIKAKPKLEKKITNKLNKKIFKNIVLAIIILIYFILINICYNSIKSEVFINVLKVFSIIDIISTIFVFEYAYKKESGKYTINGIELLMLSITTLLAIRIYTIYNNKFISAVMSFALLFAIYYVGKSIIIYAKYKRRLKKQTNKVYRTVKK